METANPDVSVLRSTEPANLGAAFLAAEIALVAGLMAWFGGAGVVIAVPLIIAVAAIWAKKTSATVADSSRRSMEFVKSVHRQFKAWGLVRKPSGWWWAGLGFACLYIAAEIFNAAWRDDALTDSVTAARGSNLSGEHGIVLQVGMVLFSLAFAPILEEIGWRGYLLGGAKALLVRSGLPGWASAAVALVGSSALFGVSHWQYDLHDRTLIVITGLAYGLVFLKTRNVLLSAAVHAAWNSFWVLGVLFFS